MEDQQTPPVRLRKAEWETLAILVGTGKFVSKDAYHEVYPNSSTPAASFRRLVKDHPEIETKIDQVRLRMEQQLVKERSMERSDVQVILMDNIDAARKADNFAAVNTAARVIADINGLTIKSKKDLERDQQNSEPEAVRSLEDLLTSIIAKATAIKGTELDPEQIAAIKRLARAAEDGAGTGSDPTQSPPALRSVS